MTAQIMPLRNFLCLHLTEWLLFFIMSTYFPVGFTSGPTLLLYYVFTAEPSLRTMLLDIMKGILRLDKLNFALLLKQAVMPDFRKLIFYSGKYALLQK